MVIPTLKFISDVLLIACLISLMLLISCLDRNIPSIQFYICLWLTLGNGFIGGLLYKICEWYGKEKY